LVFGRICFGLRSSGGGSWQQLQPNDLFVAGRGGINQVEQPNGRSVAPPPNMPQFHINETKRIGQRVSFHGSQRKHHALPCPFASELSSEFERLKY
jgi:hypothetical protein